MPLQMALDDRKQVLAELLGIKAKRERVKAIEAEMAEPTFWQDHRRSAKASSELKHLQNLLERFEAAKTEEDLSELEAETLFDEDHDDASAFLAIHAGSGGTEAQDWAEMLLRMYTRFAERRGFKVTELEKSVGDEAGIKSVTLQVEGFRAYGLLKGENGVHRLVRISPFDADKARHTSFALVEVVPELDRLEIEIEPEDLKIDVFRAGGHGGQSVNTTDSAVRITHLPTKIVVTCQNERSQLQNKEQAMKILYGKLQLLEDEKRRIETQNLKGEPVLASWGNQIRSYVMQPYQLVKDLRSNFETSAVDKVLDGHLEGLIDAYLRYLAAAKRA